MPRIDGCGQALEARGNPAGARRVWLLGADAATFPALLYAPYPEQGLALSERARRNHTTEEQP